MNHGEFSFHRHRRRQTSSSSQRDYGLTVGKLFIENQKLNSNNEFPLSNIPCMRWNMLDKHMYANIWWPSRMQQKRQLDWKPHLAASLLAAVISTGMSDDARDEEEAWRIRECLRGGRKN